MTAPGHEFSGDSPEYIIDRKTNRIILSIIRMLFWRVDFDQESLSTLKEFSKKGVIVYTSFESSQSSLLIFLYLLKKYKLPQPVMEIGFSLYAIQVIIDFFSKINNFVIRLFNRAKKGELSDFYYIKNVLCNSSIIISLLSKKLFFKRYVEISSDIFQYLIEIQKSQDKPIFVIPKIMFWNMNPERTKSLIASSATGDRGILTALLTTIKSRTPCFIRLSTPINLKEEIRLSPSTDTKFIAGVLRNRLLEIYSNEKRGILGPVIKSNQEMMEKVLNHKNVMGAIKEIKEEEKIPEKKLRRRAYGYYREIAANFSIVYIKYFQKALDIVFKRIFDGIHYDENQLKKIRKASLKGPLVIVPTHRSHMDYLIVSSIFYINKINPPHILAGSNLTFFPMGKIFRRCGAFFMRRSFKGLKLYSVIFKQYVKTMVNEGYNIEFFIEGGRTRSGKILFPKLGMLKYLIESVEEGYNRDLIFVPIALNYNRILEESSYHDEMKGNEKTAETASALVKSGRLLRRKYGRVHVEINEPVSYRELKKKFMPEGDLTKSIGSYIIKRISEKVLVTPVSLITSIILFSPASGFNRETLKSNLIVLHGYLKFMKIKHSEILNDEKNYDEIIRYVLESFKHDHIIKTAARVEYDGDSGKGFEEYFTLGNDARGRINFYKNNIVHFFIPISFLSISIMNFSQNNIASKKKIRDEFRFLKDFFSREFIYPEFMDDEEKIIDKLLAYLRKKSLVSMEGNKIKINWKGYGELRFYADILQDFFESYFIVYKAIQELQKKKITKKELLHDIRKKGILMLSNGEIKLVESLSSSNYNNALKHLVSSGALAMEDGDDEMVILLNPGIAESTLKKISDYIKKVS